MCIVKQCVVRFCATHKSESKERRQGELAFLWKIMVRRTKEEALETRNRILDAAEDVFYARGVARTSLSDIAQAAGVTRGAIYWHFRNKADVFAAMRERVKLPMETMCSPPGVEANDPLGELRTVGNFLLRQLVEDAHWRKVFEIMFNKCEFVEDTSPILKRQQESFEEGMARLSSIIEQATRRGQLPADLDIPLAVAQSMPRSTASWATSCSIRMPLPWPASASASWMPASTP